MLECVRIFCPTGLGIKKISPLMITSFQREFCNLVNRAFKQIINKDTRDFLIITHPITPTFYALPKTHKHVQNPPVRPIVYDIKSITSQASVLVDEYLHPCMESHPTYLKNTIHLLTILEGINVGAETLLVWRLFTRAYRTVWY